MTAAPEVNGPGGTVLETESPAAAGSAAAAHGVGPAKSGTRVESWAVVALTVAMIVLPVIETVVRRFGGTLPGGAVYVQHMTLWVGFIGALLATAAEKHLALSTIDMLPKGAARTTALAYGHFVSATVTAVLGLASLIMVLADTARVDKLPGGIPEWTTELIMPVGFAVMAVRFAWKTPGGLHARLISLLPVIAIGVLAALTLTKTLGPEAGATFISAHPKLLLLPGSALLVLAFLLGAPVFVVMAGFALLLFFGGGTPIASVPTETFRLVASPTLPAIPLLTVAGYVLAEGGASKRLVRAAQSLFGWMPGGLSVMAVFVCALFTTFTGASGVTILALGGLILPSLVREGYPEGFSLGLVTASGSLGLLFPPSLPVILYGVVAGVPIDRLYIGGLVPGLLMIVLVAAYGVFVGIRS
jgi:C4-dicarboxylate transporter DctM subunit